MSDEVRTRFAPSPTGYLHLGGLRTALYTYLFAKKHGGKFILRIEDTDQEREVPGAVDLIYKSMRQAGLAYDEGPDVGGEYGPYIQTQRRDLYPKFAWELVENGGAYCCFCTTRSASRRRRAEAAEAKGENLQNTTSSACTTSSLEEAQAPHRGGRALRHPPERADHGQSVLRRHALRPRRGGLRHAG